MAEVSNSNAVGCSSGEQIDLEKKVPQPLLTEHEAEKCKNRTNLLNHLEQQTTSTKSAEEQTAITTERKAERFNDLGLCGKRHGIVSEEDSVKKIKLSPELTGSGSFRNFRKLAKETGSRYQKTCCDCRHEIKRLKEQVDFWRKTARGLQEITSNLSANLNPNHNRKQRTVSTNTPVVQLPKAAIPGVTRLQQNTKVSAPPIRSSEQSTHRENAAMPQNMICAVPSSSVAAGVSQTVAIHTGSSLPAPLVASCENESTKSKNVLPSNNNGAYCVDLTSDDDDENPEGRRCHSLELGTQCQQKLATNSNKVAIVQPVVEHLPPVPQASPKNGAKISLLPRLRLLVCKVETIGEKTRVTLKWDSEFSQIPSCVEEYELFAFQPSKCATGWSLIKSMKALDLPMACVVTLIRNSSRNEKYHFTVRAIGTDGSKGAGSDPKAVTC